MIDSELMESTLSRAMSAGGEWAEVFVEDVTTMSAHLDDGRIEELGSRARRGAGIRVVKGDTTGFAHTSDLSPEGLATAARTAGAVAAGGASSTTVALGPMAPATRPPVEVDPREVAKERKVGLLRAADEAGRAASDKITQFSAGYSDSRRFIQVATTDGIHTSDLQTRCLARASAIATGDAGMQTGYESVGRTVGFELFDDHDVTELARVAAEQAITKLSARPAPRATLPVVIGPGGGGVMFHEACGHGLEADLIAKKASVYAGRLGEMVASDLVTLVDDGTMAGEWGNLGIDDEGRSAQHNVLIRDGILEDYLWDVLRARKEGRASSGNGRRQSYQHLPMVRMTNTYLGNGSTDPADIIADTPEGIYVAGMGGGQVNTATGDFVFGIREAYLIEDGKITEPIREGNLIGNGPEVLRQIDAVGNDFAMGHPGMCGKDGQGVPVGDGTPTVRVPALTIGGTAG